MCTETKLCVIEWMDRLADGIDAEVQYSPLGMPFINRKTDLIEVEIIMHHEGAVLRPRMAIMSVSRVLTAARFYAGSGGIADLAEALVCVQGAIDSHEGWSMKEIKAALANAQDHAPMSAAGEA